MNKNKLRSIMILKGDKIGDLAGYLGRSRQSLHNKLSGKSEFTQSEMAAIKKRYQMSDKDFAETFAEE